MSNEDIYYIQNRASEMHKYVENIFKNNTDEKISHELINILSEIDFMQNRIKRLEYLFSHN